jgi:secreted trypsin-like serine protease
MRALAVLPLLISLAACTSEAADRAASSDGKSTRRVSAPIVNGQPDTSAHDSVVYIAIGTQGSFCTGTLIAPNLVITARHCVADPDETQECGAFGATKAASTFTISMDLQHATTIATGSKVIVDTTKPNNICGNDISLIQLDRDVPSAMLSKVRLTKLTTGETATTAGYGDDGTGNVTASRFLKTGIKVDAVGPSPYTYTTATGEALPVTLPAGEIVTGESTCFGDSGGPLFDGAGNIIGMTSRGIDENCNDRPSIFTDTASHAAVITAAAAAAGHPLQAAAPLPDSTSDATPQSDPTSADGTAADDTETSVDAPTTTTTKKTKSSLGATSSAGCSAAPGASLASSSSSLPLLGLALLAASRRRRRRDNA